MAKETKKERMFQAISVAHSGRNMDRVQQGINQMLFVLAEGTKWEEDVTIAFEILEEYQEMRRDGRFSD